MKTKVENVYSPINDKNIKKELDKSPIWRQCYTKDELFTPNDEYKRPEFQHMWKYSIKFQGLTPIQVTAIKKVR